ncbi:hypothetical protein FOA52_004540 [Chlamydomonas sp. UWO 241]|nr:hypothetical protein FOA52_004540 [Chlamydomonas sp. UWO 241]
MPPVLTGGAAILAKMRARKEAAEVPKPKPDGKRKVVFTYASQTGTASEIARTLHAEATQRGFESECASLDELGFQRIGVEGTPVLVVVAASTGDGEPPDNAAATFLALKKPGAPDKLKGVAFTLLGLGDSNYTRFMHVSRILKERLLALGATPFYPCLEADEVDGLEERVEPWNDGLWGPLIKALAGEVVDPEPAAAAAAVAKAAEVPKPPQEASPAQPAQPAHAQVVPPRDVGLVDGLAPGVPAPLPSRLVIDWHADGDEATARARADASGAPSNAAEAHRDPAGVYSADAPFWATVSDARVETAEWSDRRVLHMEFDLGDSGIGAQYEAGDSVGVAPENDAGIVERLLKRLKRTGGDAFSVRPADGGTQHLAPHLPTPCTLGHALSRCLDITSPARKSLLRVLAEHCTDEAEKRTLMFLTARAGKDAYAHEILEQQPSLADVLERFPSCDPPLAALLDALTPLLPRLYSVTSSPAEVPGHAQVAFSVVSFETKYGTRKGVATTWLDTLSKQLLKAPGAGAAPDAPAPRLAIFLKRAADFKPPSDLSKPVIMVGPGTGVAPFRGFLQRRRRQIRAAHPGGLPEGELPTGVAPTWLYFGCRKSDEDFLYRADLEGFEADKTLTRLRVAFSRAQADKLYVQHLMRSDAAALGALIDAGGYVFVCGDGGQMVKDVHAALVDAIKAHKNCSDEEAGVLLQGMVKDKRYIRDVWS